MYSTTAALHACHTSHLRMGNRTRHACNATASYMLCHHANQRALLVVQQPVRTRQEDEHCAGRGLAGDPAQRGRAEVIIQLLRVQRAHGAQHRVAAARAAQRGEPGQLRGGLLRRALRLARRGPCGARRRQLPLGLLGPAASHSQLREPPDLQACSSDLPE